MTENLTIEENSKVNVAYLSQRMWQSGFYVEAIAFKLFPAARAAILKGLYEIINAKGGVQDG